MSFVGYKITKNILYNLWLYREIAFRWLTFMIFCANDVFVSLFLCSKWDVYTILIRAWSRTPLLHLSRGRSKTPPCTLFEYDNFCNFILKFKLQLKRVTYIFIPSFNLVTAHNFAVKIGVASSTISGNKQIMAFMKESAEKRISTTKQSSLKKYISPRCYCKIASRTLF